MQSKEDLYHKINDVVKNVQKVMVGKEEEIQLSLIALLVKGHVLLEGVPGVGKTMLVRALAKSIACDFSRIQFTPDLLPSDITGVSVFHPKELTFNFHRGPLLSNVVLADEINRTSPRTQSSLLEAMAEESVTVDGNTYELEQPFLVMATQNPLEFSGTYPLPEAQLDRFLFKVIVDYPNKDEEKRMLMDLNEGYSLEQIEAVMTKKEVIACQNAIKDVHVSEAIVDYIIDLVNETRSHALIYLGVSPRASLAVVQAAQALAFMDERDYVIPDDIQKLVPYIFRHRLILTDEASFSAIDVEQVIQEIIEKVAVPVYKGSSE